MADDVREFSKEEAQGTLFHGAPQPSLAAPVVQPSVQRASNIPVPPPLSVKSVEKGTPVAKAPNALSLVKTVSEANKELQGSMPTPKPPSAIGGLIDDLTANWKPLAIGAGAVLTGMAAKRFLTKKEPTAPAVRTEPTFATPEETATFKPIDQPSAPSKLALESEAKFGAPLADVENHFGVKITNLKDAEILTNNYKNSLPQGMTSAIPTGQPNVSANPAGAFSQTPNYSPAVPQSGFDPSRIGQPLQDPLAGRGYQTPAQEIGPRIPPTATEILAAGGTPTQIATQTAAQEIDAVPKELRTGTGKIAYAGTGPEPTISSRTGNPQFKKEYASLADVPKGYALVPGGQYIDPLRQDLGQIEYTKAFTGRDFPQTYEEAISTGKDINRSLGRATREEAKAAGLPYGEITPGIAQKTTENKKLVKIIGKAGLAGALVSLADLALAKTPEDKANAGMGLLGAILPPGMDIFPAGEGSTLSKEQLLANQIGYENQFKLGSPYAQTEAAKTYRLRERAGAGRGIAPPSAYQR